MTKKTIMLNYKELFFEMKKAIILIICFLVFSAAYADIPFGVKPKEIIETGMIPHADLVGEQTNFGVDAKGNLLMSYEYSIGNRIGVELEGIEYRLSFWNVGKLGGTSGIFFWKKDYSKAVLTITPKASNPGLLVVDSVDNSKLGMPKSWKMEYAKKDPEFRPTSCILQFSGGPNGIFEGTCNTGEEIKGRLLSGGNSAVFDTIKGEKVHEPLKLIKGVALPLYSKPFSDWNVDIQGCEDSGTRFNSISGTVEVASDELARKNSWGFARLETVLCVDDHVKTGEESEAILSFADMSTFVMKPETEIIINSPPKRDSKMGILYGKIKANINKIAKDGTMEIEMSQAVAGIKGTTFVLEEDGKKSVLKVLDGEVEFKSKANNQKENIKEGEMIDATITGLSAKQIFDVNEELKNWPENKFPMLPLIIVMIAFTIITIIALAYMFGKKFKK